MEKGFSIGSANKNHLTIEDASVSPSHAKILNKGENYFLKDLGSQEGTLVNGQRINQKQIACGDVLSLGNVELEVIDPLDAHDNSNYWSLIADSSWLSGQEFPIIGEVDQIISIGRSAQCDIVLAGTHLSRLHAEITINYSSLTLRDMGSANGTYVNDKKVVSQQIYPGDKVRLDVYSFRVFGPGISLPESATTAIHKIPDFDNPENDLKTKKWKSKPTSPGNREEINLYQQRYRHIVLAGIVLAGIAAAVAYVGWGIVSGK